MHKRLIRIGLEDYGDPDLLSHTLMIGYPLRIGLIYKIPLLLNFKDKNKNNYRKENIELLCYNHYFLTVGDIFSDKQIKGIEDHVPVNQSEVEWEMDDYTRQRLIELGLNEPEKEIGDELISRI